MSQQILLGGDGVTGETGATHNSKANSNFTELYAATAAAQADADAAQSDISTHISANPAHIADNISVTPFGTIGATNVQDALEEIAAELGASVPDASDTVKGILETATTAETQTGTDTTRAVTPAGAAATYVTLETWATLTDSATVTWNTNNRQNPLAKLTSTQSFTIDMTNVKNGSRGMLKLITNTASAITLTFDTSFTNKQLNSTITSHTFPALTAQEYILEYVLDGTTIEWIIGDITQILPSARLQRVATQSTTNGGTAAVIWDTENSDTASIWAASPNATRLVIPGSGNKRARLTGWVQWANNGATITGVRRVFIYRNGSYSAADGGFAQGAPQASQDFTLSFAFQIDCAGGDYLEVVPVNTSATLNIVALVHITIEPR